MEPVIERLHGHLQKTDPGGVLGVYLFGSSALGCLRPSSDIDVLILTQRSLSRDDRQSLTAFLVQFSGSRATVAPGRPLEVTSLVLEDVVPWRYPPVCDFLYGEWLRAEFLTDSLPQRHSSTDLAVLVTSVRHRATCLQGPRPSELLAPVPPQDLRRAIHDSLGPLLNDLVGDERNVLLTLARMVVTLETGQIVSKDEAATLISPSLPEPHRAVLQLAAHGYIGEVIDEWSGRQEQASETAEHLAQRIRAARP